MILSIALVVIMAFAGVISAFSFHKIKPEDVGLVIKDFGKKLSDGELVARNGEAGYQLEMLQPGWRFKLWPIFRVESHPRVQNPMDGIGIVISQIGKPLDPGAKTAVYNDDMGDFSDVTAFLAAGGQQGVQRPVLQPGATVPIHPIAFIVVTKNGVFGKPLSESMEDLVKSISAEKLSVTKIIPTEDNKDIVGIVTVLDGPALPSGDIACRLGGFLDIKEAEVENQPGGEIIQKLLGTKNNLHNNYQNFQDFLAAGGCMGLQHDPLLYGTYIFNPFLVNVEIVPMLVVQQGQVAVIKSSVGLPPEDLSGEGYKYGSIVNPGHRGIWEEPLRTGKYALNPRIYQAEIVPTSILTLNWANATSEAHNLDARLSKIDAKSNDTFAFGIDLQVQIHIPDTKASKVVGMVGTMKNLVNEVLQSAVGNHFRNALQKLSGAEFIKKREQVQIDAEAYVLSYLEKYDVEVKGVYIQDIVFPEDLISVLKQREIAIQQVITYDEERKAQLVRVDLEKQKGTADKQKDLAAAEVSVEINVQVAKANIAEADGKAKVIETTAKAEASKIEMIGGSTAGAVKALGLAKAEGYKAQVDVLGSENTTSVAIIQAIADGSVNITPNILVNGGGSDNSNGMSGIATALIAQVLDGKNKTNKDESKTVQETKNIITPKSDKE